MFDSTLPISYYKEIAVLNEAHDIYFVQHIETKKVFIKKTLSVYNLDVYEQLFKTPIRNIPRIYALYENTNTLTMIEEYISGDSLQEVVDLCGPLAESDVISYCIQLCDILSDLHSLSPAIIHRDIKPSNIILTEDERIYLIDFNAAKQSSIEKNRDTRLLGTEGFAAPEQFGFGSSSSQTDIYAVGNLMKALLCPNDIIKPISSRLNAVINKCLEINPKDRYHTTALLKNALEKI